ncbi:hypothetical protein K8I61_12445 [bacterium]|nr:hypothetical protein [bacterium]
MRKGVYTALAIIIALVFGESFTAATGLSRSPEEALFDDIHSAMYDLLPHAKIPRALGPGSDAVNSLGFRGPEFDARKPANTVRIFCVGDSTTFGHTLRPHETYSAHLPALLADAWPGKRAEVINAGVPGTTLPQHIYRVRAKVLPLQPDIVVVQTAFDANYPKLRALNALRRDIRRPRDPRPSPLSRSHLYRAMRRLIKGGVHADVRSAMQGIVELDGTVEMSGAIRRQFRNDVELLVKTCRRGGVRLALQLPAVAPRVNAMRAASLAPGTDAFDDAVFAEELWRIVREISRRENLTIVNPYETLVAYAGDEPLFFDDGIHPTAIGHRLFAEAIARAITAHP